MEESVARELGMPNPSPLDVVSYAIASRESWSKSNWRQIKASLIFRYTQMGTEHALKAANMIASHSQSACLNRSNKTSAQRLKNVPIEDLEEMLRTIRATKSRYAMILEQWLKLGAIFGLRPHEWTQAQVVWMAPSQAQLFERDDEAALEGLRAVGDAWEQGSETGRLPLSSPSHLANGADSEEDPCWHLRVLNSKNSNGRSHGLFRHLNLSECSLDLVRQAAEFSHLMANAKANDLYEAYYEACKRLLHRLNVKMGKQGRKHIQLYSARHIFTSNAKATYTIREVGALMGHATDRTATSHYGKRRHGVTGGDWVKPNEAEVSRVALRLHSFPGSRNAPKGSSSVK